MLSHSVNPEGPGPFQNDTRHRSESQSWADVAPRAPAPKRLAISDDGLHVGRISQLKTREKIV